MNPVRQADVLTDVAWLVDRARQHERRALARLLTVVENGTAEQTRQVTSAVHHFTGHARVIGLTGPPGAGKSTITSAVAAELRSRGRTVAVLAVDPSSPFSGGSLLGDRIRMQGHQADPGVYIRSMAARGHLGGLAAAASWAVAVMDAAGFDDVIIETVGVGQSEVEIAQAADTTVVALAPGMGDRVQAAKAGVLEIADVFAVNKADQAGSGQLRSELAGMLAMDPGAQQWAPPILLTVAVRAEGIAALTDAIEAHGAHLLSSGEGVRRRRDRAARELKETAMEQIRMRFTALDPGVDDLLAALAGRVVSRELDPNAAADALLDAIGSRLLP